MIKEDEGVASEKSMMAGAKTMAEALKKLIISTNLKKEEKNEKCK